MQTQDDFEGKKIFLKTWFTILKLKRIELNIIVKRKNSLKMSLSKTDLSLKICSVDEQMFIQNPTKKHYPVSVQHFVLFSQY